MYVYLHPIPYKKKKICVVVVVRDHAPFKDGVGPPRIARGHHVGTGMDDLKNEAATWSINSDRKVRRKRELFARLLPATLPEKRRRKKKTKTNNTARQKGARLSNRLLIYMLFQHPYGYCTYFLHSSSSPRLMHTSSTPHGMDGWIPGSLPCFQRTTGAVARGVARAVWAYPDAS